VDIIAQTTDFWIKEKTAAAIGKFDGMHIGHRKLLESILEQKKDGLSACVFTFDPAPATLFGYTDGKELTTKEEKRILLERMGVDILIEFPLNKGTAAILPEDFIKDILVKRMKTLYLAAGNDLSFGAGGVGNPTLLCKMAAECGFTVNIIDKVLYRGEPVSSTYVRTCLETGNMEKARLLLGMPFTIMGKVRHGNRIGSALGMPTVNLKPRQGKLLPPIGVYYSSVRHDGHDYPAVSNLGYRPTVSHKDTATGENDWGSLTVESYIYGFHQEIYGEEIEVGLHSFRRKEQDFISLDALKAQLAKDIQAGEAWWSTYHK
jgi:riboflavin kinase/FMN adenylyltransferase